jgi:hypothetical protein
LLGTEGESAAPHGKGTAGLSFVLLKEAITDRIGVIELS